MNDMLLTVDTFDNIEVGDLIFFCWSSGTTMHTLVVSTRHEGENNTFSCVNLDLILKGMRVEPYEYDITLIKAKNGMSLILIKGN